MSKPIDPFAGNLITPGDSGYDAARSIWNAAVNKKPSLIARCAGVSDVVAAVKYGRDHNLVTAIRGGGHNVGGRALCDGGLVIDLSGMRAVHVDPATRRVRVQGGATLADLDRETQVFGLAVPVGIVPKTGVAGLTLGGGVGWLVRKHGLTIDNLISCQVVTADGRTITASSTENSDLLWALKGGGGNFGVVVSLEFQAHPIGMVIGGMAIYPRAAAFDVIRHWRDFIADAPDEVTAYAALLHTPDGTPVSAVIPCYCGPDLAEGERVLAPLRKFGSPLMDAIQPMPFAVQQSLLAPAFPDGNQNYWKATMLPSLPDAAVEAIVDQANRATSPLSAIAIECYTGAPARIDANSAAYPHRDLAWHAVVAGQCQDPAGFPAIRDWTRTADAALRPFAGEGRFLSTLDADEEDRVNTAFGANLPRLAEIKQRYDPSNFFRVNQNIAPASRAARA